MELARYSANAFHAKIDAIAFVAPLARDAGRRLRIAPERMLVVGDTTFDIALRGGATTVGPR